MTISIRQHSSCSPQHEFTCYQVSLLYGHFSRSVKRVVNKTKGKEGIHSAEHVILLRVLFVWRCSPQKNGAYQYVQQTLFLMHICANTRLSHWVYMLSAFLSVPFYTLLPHFTTTDRSSCVSWMTNGYRETYIYGDFLAFVYLTEDNVGSLTPSNQVWQQVSAYRPL